MIKEMKALSITSSYAGFLYEGFAARVLAAGRAPSSGLVLMKARDETTFFVPAGSNPDTTVNPFSRAREKSYAFFSAHPRALDLEVDPKKPLVAYFWKLMAPNNPLFDAFIIEFETSDRTLHAIVWILQMTLSTNHGGGSSEGYQLIDLIKTKAMSMSRSPLKVGKVTVKYVLVSPTAGEWKLPKTNWKLYKGDVYYQRVDY